MLEVVLADAPNTLNTKKADVRTITPKIWNLYLQPKEDLADVSSPFQDRKWSYDV